MIAAGIDVAGDRAHVVVLTAGRRISDAFVLDARLVASLAERLADCTVIAVDAPADPSGAPHADGSAPNPKFATARCAEIELGLARGIWVPWTTPHEPPYRPWMRTGFEIYRALETSGAQVVETYPHGVFRTMAGGFLASKLTALGLAQRIELLAATGIEVPHLHMWGHDGIDALAAAHLALAVSTGTATAITCGHDDSAIWLP